MEGIGWHGFEGISGRRIATAPSARQRRRRAPISDRAERSFNVGTPCQTCGVEPRADVLVTTIIVIFLFAALCAALAVVTVALRRPTTVLIAVAGGLVGLCFLIVSVLPYNVPLLFGAALAVLGVALSVLGGNPFSRWALAAADGGRTKEGTQGGILVELMAERAQPHEEEILRGGTAIGYLERAAVALGILAGFPAVIAILVALKGIGRFTELATPAARERFIVGTLASLLWASTVAGMLWLAIW